MISPVISARGYHCKFYPTCSEYTKQAIKKYGIIKGSFLGMKRILKCTPNREFTFDPVPPKKTKISQKNNLK